jgi:hypothetical protein
VRNPRRAGDDEAKTKRERVQEIIVGANAIVVDLESKAWRESPRPKGNVT